MAIPRIFPSLNGLAMLACTSLLVVPLCFCGLLAYPSLRARYLLRKLESLPLVSTFLGADRLAREIGAQTEGSCSHAECEWIAKISNSVTPRWWRGAGETFLVSFDVTNGVVVRRNDGYGVGLETDGVYSSSVGFIEQENWGRIPRHIPVSAGWKTTSWYPYYEFTVYMTPSASAEDRQRFTAYNFNCFWKYHGCKDARELLPVSATFYIPPLNTLPDNPPSRE